MSSLLCASCGHRASKMCSGCSNEYYCSVGCQQTHAAVHACACNATPNDTVRIPKTSAIAGLLHGHQQLLGVSIDANQNYVVGRHIADALRRHVAHCGLRDRTQSMIGDELEDKIDSEYEALKKKKATVDKLLQKSDKTAKFEATLMKRHQRLIRQLAANRRRRQNVLHNRSLKLQQVPWDEILRHVPNPLAALQTLSSTSKVLSTDLASTSVTIELARQMDIGVLKTTFTNAIVHGAHDIVRSILQAQKYRKADDKLSDTYFYRTVRESMPSFTAYERGIWHVVTDRDATNLFSAKPITDRRVLTGLVLREYGLSVCGEQLDALERTAVPLPNDFDFPDHAYLFAAGLGNHLGYVKRYTAWLEQHKPVPTVDDADELVRDAMVRAAEFDNDVIFRYLFVPHADAGNAKFLRNLVHSVLQEKSWVILSIITNHVPTVDGRPFMEILDQGDDDIEISDAADPDDEWELAQEYDRARDLDTKSVLIRCVDDDNIEGVTWLLDKGANIYIEFYNQTATNFTQSAQMLRLLIERDGDVYSGFKDDVCLFDAIRYKDLSLIDLILSKASYTTGLSSGTLGHSPVWSAVQSGDVQIVKRMTDYGFTAKAVEPKEGYYGPSPLESAALKGFTDIAAHLLACLQPSAISKNK